MWECLWKLHFYLWNVTDLVFAGKFSKYLCIRHSKLNRPFPVNKIPANKPERHKKFPQNTGDRGFLQQLKNSQVRTWPYYCISRGNWQFFWHLKVYNFSQTSFKFHPIPRKELRNARSPAQHSKNIIQKRHKTRNAFLFCWQSPVGRSSDLLNKTIFWHPNN